MNLNPLKKDDNTDALVKALEDANNMGQTSAPSVNDTTTDSSSDDTAAQIANDPDLGASNNLSNSTTITDSNSDESTTLDTSSADENANNGIAFTGNDLPEGISTDAGAHTATSDVNDSDLDGVKKSALEQLRPLIEKLDLEPADKFDKYLMMLRASDDPTLIKPAFDAAESINGEKEKAQALLDIINEINYITSNQTATE